MNAIATFTVGNRYSLTSLVAVATQAILWAMNAYLHWPSVQATVASSAILAVLALLLAIAGRRETFGRYRMYAIYAALTLAVVRYVINGPQTPIENTHNPNQVRDLRKP